jgi:hypothetical protein
MIWKKGIGRNFEKITSLERAFYKGSHISSFFGFGFELR